MGVEAKGPGISVPTGEAPGALFCVKPRRFLTPPQLDNRMGGPPTMHYPRRRLSEPVVPGTEAHDVSHQYAVVPPSDTPDVEDTLDTPMQRGLVTQIGARIVRAALPFLVAFGASAQPSNAEDPIYTPKPGISGQADPGRGVEAAGIRVGISSRTQSTRTETQASSETQTVEKTWEKTAVTPEWLRANPQDVRGIEDHIVVNGEVRRLTTIDSMNGNGEVTRQFVIKDNGLIYESTYDPVTKQMSEYMVLSETKAPIENPQSFVVFPNGTIVVGGEHPIRSTNTGIAYSFDWGKTWSRLEELNGARGTVKNMVVMPQQEGVQEDKILTNHASFEDNVIRMYELKIDHANKTVKIQQTDLTVVIDDVMMSGYDASTDTITIAGNASQSLKPGLIEIKYNPQTRSGKVEILFADKGDLYGNGRYIDEQNELHYVRSDIERQRIYDFNMTRRTVHRTIPYASMINHLNIPNFRQIGFDIFETELYKDPKDNKLKLVWGGDFSSLKDGLPRPIIGFITYDGSDPRTTVVANAFEQDSQSGIYPESGMKIKKIPNSEPAVDVIVRSLGKAVYGIYSNKVVPTDKGMNQTTRPTRRVLLPAIGRNADMNRRPRTRRRIPGQEPRPTEQELADAA